MPPSMYVAIGLLAAFTIICVVVLRRFSADECLKIIGLFTGFFGLSFGAFCGYFFNRNEVLTAQRQATEYGAQLASVLRDTAEAKTTLVDTVNSRPATFTMEELKYDKDYKAVLNKLSDASVIVYDRGIMWPRHSLPSDKSSGEMAEKKK